ncbi:MAG: DUF362 domain-containing protein [Bryobacteraceae bacterium]|nr:DUF362 domain-containing protein [Bryobacteraceae bacterium]
MNRRTMLHSLGLTVTTTFVANNFVERCRPLFRQRKHSHAAVLRCSDYNRASPVIRDGLRLFSVPVHGKRVLLKPNLVEYSSAAPINTHPIVVAAAADALYSLGAAEVVVADGPGHVRDTMLLLDESGLRSALGSLRDVRFVDLNTDSVRRVRPRGGFTSLDELWLPEAVLSADIVISVPKIKTHHWAGVTLSLKNLFGVAPGSVYGWPKNVLHWQGISRSIAELAATVPVHFVIADGIEAMEGNGPLHGAARPLRCLVLGDDPVATDATCSRLMGIDPARVRHLRMVSSMFGNLREERIEQRGESVRALAQAFELLPAFSHLRP